MKPHPQCHRVLGCAALNRRNTTRNRDNNGKNISRVRPAVFPAEVKMGKMADARSQCNKAKMPTGRGQKSEVGHYNHEIEGAKGWRHD